MTGSVVMIVVVEGMEDNVMVDGIEAANDAVKNDEVV
jgi:hypothetical protein